MTIYAVAITTMTYLFSSFTGLPEQHFHGYAFVGADFISGSEGAERFYRAGGRPITSATDGCYLSVWRTPDGRHRIGVDTGGLKKLLWYSDGVVWGVSNSLIALAEHLIEHGVNLRADEVSLAGLQITNTTVTTQLATYETLISGIRLLPTWYDLEIDAAGARMVRRIHSPPRDYTSILYQYIA